jgi:hypothetical protein
MRGFPTSIPRTNLPGSRVDLEEETDEEEEPDSAPAKSDRPSAHAEAARQMAKAMAGGIQTGRRMNERVGTFLQKFIPRPASKCEFQKAACHPNIRDDIHCRCDPCLWW